MRPTAVRQRRQAHKLRLALPRALHVCRQARHNFSRAVKRAYKLGEPGPLVRIGKPLRKHAKLLRRTLFVLGT